MRCSLQKRLLLDCQEFNVIPRVRANLLPNGKLNRYTSAPFGAARIDNRPSPYCFHTNEKSMCFLAACYRRLISAFHSQILFGIN
jgi:hypothetical protein